MESKTNIINLTERRNNLPLKRELTKKLDFLKTLKEQLEEDDYVDVLCGILDPEMYEELDSDLKMLVIIYYQQLNA